MKIKQIPNHLQVKDTLFKAPEPSDEHLKLPPSAFQEERKPGFFQKYLKALNPSVLITVICLLLELWITGWFITHLALFYRS